MSDELLRGFAPITPSAWQMIDQEASRVLQVHLTARRLIQTRGPLGWDHSAVNSGRATRLEEYGGSTVQTLVREVQPMLELRAPFELARDELESIGRGNPAPDLSPLTEAARNIAAAEDRLVYTGLASAFVRGMHSHSEHEPVALDGDYHNYPDAVALAFERLRRAGVGGPYAMALGTRCFSGLNTTTTVGGYPVLEHVRRIVDGPIIAVPVLDGALVLSQRGGDFELVLGRDLSVGYSDHDARSVRLYFEESLTFRLHGPSAAVPLVYQSE